MTIELQGVSRAIKLLVLALSLLFVLSRAAGADQPLEGRFHGIDGVDGVWLGIVGDDPGVANWTHFEGASFELSLPLSELTMLIALAKDRVPQVIRIPSGAYAEPLEIDFSRGLSLEGVVLSEDGMPLLNAKVTMAAGDIHGIEVPAFARPVWTTSDRGTFRVGGLVRRRYVIEVTAEGHVPLVLKDVLIQEEDVNRTELQLSGAYYVTGKVLNQEGVPSSGIEVTATWMEVLREPRLSEGVIRGLETGFVGRRVAAAVTSVDGSYRFGPFEAATNVEVTGESISDMSTTRSYRVSAPHDDLVLLLHRDVIRGRVLDSVTGEPLESFSVNTSGGGRGKSAIRNPDGQFAVPVHAETHTIFIDAPGYFPWIRRLFTSASGEYDFGDILIGPARTVTGYLRDSTTGAPIAGAIIRRSSQQYDDPYISMLTNNWFVTLHFAHSDEQGKYVLGKLPYHADQLEVWVTDHGGREVSLPAAVEKFDIDLAFNSVVAGYLELPNGTPAMGVVRLIGKDSRNGFDVAEDGRFRWEGLGPGDYRIEGESEVGAVESKSLSLDEGEWLEGIRLVVQPGRRISGKITGLTGSERVQFTVRDGSRKRVLPGHYGNGAYSLRGLPQKVILAARTTIDRELSYKIHFSDQDEGELDLNFAATSRLSGTVMAAGRRVHAVELRVAPLGRGGPRAYDTTTETGDYVVAGISDGLHRIRMRTGHSFDVEVVGDTIFNIELPAVSLSGRVRAEHSAIPVRSGSVRLKRIDPHATSPAINLRAQIASDGSFFFDGLVAGEYELRAVHPDFDPVLRRVSIGGEEVVTLFLKRNDSEFSAAMSARPPILPANRMVSSA